MTWGGTAPSGRFFTLNIGGGQARVDWEEARGDVSGLIDNLIVIGLRSTPVGSAVPVFGDVLFFDGSEWVPAASGGAGAHDLLSSTHTDTIIASPTDGDIIAGSGASASWARFPIGQPGQSLTVSTGNNLQWSGLGLIKTEVFTSGTVFNLNSETRRILINTSNPTTANLPSVPLLYQQITIKDAAGGAGPPTFNTITVSPPSGVTIDGNTSLLMRTDYQSFDLLWNGTEWNVI